MPQVAPVSLVLFLLAGLLLQGCSQQVQPSCNIQCQQDQQTALLSLYTSTGGDNWHNSSGWQDASDPSHPAATSAYCSWFGVTCCTVAGDCAVAGAVTLIQLRGNNLTGSLPATGWSALQPALVSLDLRDNSLSGTLPAGILQLSLLEDLWLTQNKFSGQLIDFTSLPAFSTLFMAANRLSGTLPPSIANSNVALIDLSGNQLSGSIPADWHSAPQLALLNLSGNKLTGPLTGPPAPALEANEDLSSSMFTTATAASTTRALMNIIIDHNQLSGTLPDTLGLLPITVFIITHNQFSGTLPSMFLSMPFARDLEIAHNQFTGSLPEQFDSLALEVLDVSDNQLTGTVPPQFASASILRVLTLSNNMFSGAVPANFAQMKQMRLLFMNGARLAHEGARNSRGDPLPPWMVFNTLNGRSGGYAHEQEQLVCYPVMANASYIPLLSYITLDPSYFYYSQCSCTPGWDLHRLSTNSVSCVLHVAGVLDGRNGWLYVALPTAVAVAVLMASTFLVLRWRMPGKRVLKKRGRAATETEKQATLVMTSIEALEELHSWNAAAVRSAKSIHDRVIRSLLPKYKGHELHAEGDVFMIHFDETTDAVAWCLATQQALLAAAWPPQLQQHAFTRLQTEGTLKPFDSGILESPGGSAEIKPAGIPRTSSIIKQPMSKTLSVDNASMPGTPSGRKKRLQWDSDIDHYSSETIKAGKSHETPLFAGLRVRMCVLAGCKEREQRVDVYKLPLLKSTEQYHRLLQIAEPMSKAIHGGQVMVEAKAFSAINNRLTDIAGLVPEAPVGRNGDGHGVTVVAQPFNIEAADSMNGTEASPRSSVFARTKSFDSKRSSSFGDGPSAMSRMLSSLLKTSNTSQGDRDTLAASAGREGVMVVDMGLHLLTGLPEAQQLHQVLVPGLLERARRLPPLQTAQQLSPGYFDAPGTAESPLTSNSSYLSRKPVTLVFTHMDKYAQMKQENASAAALALTLYRDCLRKILARHGIECQELDGSFMLAFGNVIEAIKFCVLAQEALLGVVWGSAVLALSSCKPLTSDTTHTLVWQGPRVKMGIYEGVPTRIMPHSTTGRADYFGPLVNRCARICNSGAQGGQILTSWHVIEKALRHWAPAALLAVPEEGQQPIMVSASHEEEPQPSDATRRDSVQPSELTSALEAWQRQSSQTEADLQQAEAAAQPALQVSGVPGPSMPPDKPTLHDSPPFLGSGGASTADAASPGPSVPPLSEGSSPPRTRLHMRHNSMPTVPHSFWSQKRTSRSESNEAPQVPPDATAPDHSARSAPESRVSLDDIQAHAAESQGTEVPAHGMIGQGDGEEQDPWDGITHLQIHHAGQFKFKGWVEPQALMQINSGRLAGRGFARELSTGKATMVAPAQGLKLTLVFEDNVRKMQDLMAGLESDDASEAEVEAEDYEA